MKTCRHFSLWAAVLIALHCASTSQAALGVISTTLSPAGPVAVGSTFVVSLSIAGYTEATQVNAYQFVVTYPTLMFSFVGAFDHGTTAAGATQQWLAKATQESEANGYSPTPASTGSTPGSVLIDLTDAGFSVTEGGTIAAAGFMVSFTMQANAQGTGSFTPAAPPGGTVFFDTALGAVAGQPTFAGASMTVIPEPSAILLSAVALLGTVGVVRRRR